MCSRSKSREEIYLELPERLLPVVVVLTFAAAVWSQWLQIVAAQIVRTATANEIRAADTPGKCRSRLVAEEARGARTEAVIETKNWRVERLIEFNLN
jgi:hypothetical protein